MKIVFADRCIAEDGTDETDVISLSPLQRTSANETVKLIGSRGVYKLDNSNAEYSITAVVPYFCESWEHAHQRLFEISQMLEDLREGELLIRLNKTSLSFLNAVVEAELPDEITGCFFEISYKFTGAFVNSMMGQLLMYNESAYLVNGQLLRI